MLRPAITGRRVILYTSPDAKGNGPDSDGVNGREEKMPVIDSQWAAQFAVAAELVRRRYSVAFYLGNQPLYDALVRGSTPVTSSRYRSRAVKTPKKPGGQWPSHSCRQA
jgi:hypothetical protein